MPRKPCLVHRCPNYALEGRSYCAAHTARRADLGLTGERGTTGNWRRLRRIVLRNARGRCQCGAPATDVHHVDGNSANNSIGNLIALCWRCHRAAHGAKPRQLLGG